MTPRPKPENGVRMKIIQDPDHHGSQREWGRRKAVVPGVNPLSEGIQLFFCIALYEVTVCFFHSLYVVDAYSRAS